MIDREENGPLNKRPKSKGQFIRIESSNQAFRKAKFSAGALAETNGQRGVQK
jgi:hypothetical protein